MHFSNVVCLLHVLSPWRAKADGFFDFVREPIRQGCGIDIGYAPGKMPSRLHPGFDLAEFRALAQQNCEASPDDLWLATYHRMPDAALDYLFAHLPDGALILSSEIPPWLRQACQDRQQPYLDVRQSPLGFGRDSFMALDTNDDTLRQRLGGHAISDDELRLEASLLTANMRIHRAQLAESLRHVFNLDGALLYLWQMPWDTSLLQPDGRVLHISDFAAQLKGLAQGRQLLFFRDFNDTYAAQLYERECAALCTLLGQQVKFCPQNIYQSLAGLDDSELVSINATAHQEAAYFDKKSHAFAPPITPLASSAQQPGYLQVHFQDFLAPDFWHQMLAPHAAPPRIPRLPALDRQHARESMNDWGDYEKVLTWERSLPWNAYRRLGGIVTNRRIAALEKHMTSLTQAMQQAASAPTKAIAPDQASARIRALKDTKLGQTAYILGNGPSLNDLDIDKLMALESFWCNHAYKMEENGHRFHPKYYFLYDAAGILMHPQEILNIEAGIKFLSPEASRAFEIMKPEACENIITFQVAHEHAIHESEENFSLDPSLTLFWSSSILIVAIQFAFYMGYSKVFIGGIDLDYSKPYFYNSYNQHKSSAIALATEQSKLAFPIIRKIFEKHGRTLAKITESPNLPLDFIDIPELRSRNSLAGA